MRLQSVLIASSTRHEVTTQHIHGACKGQALVLTLRSGTNALSLVYRYPWSFSRDIVNHHIFGWLALPTSIEQLTMLAPSNVPESAPFGDSHDNEQPTSSERHAYVFSALYCCFNGVDMDNIMLCCKGETEFLCCVNEHCCAAMVEPFGIGMVTDQQKGEFCKLGMFCCTCGLKKPQVFCSGATQFMCLVQVQSLPLDPYHVKEPACAYCCISCLPTMGCAEPLPYCPALEKIKELTTPASEVIVRN
jgi:hypothetical protein